VKKELSEKEKLFCDLYLKTGNSREAAARSGYMFAEKTASRLLKRKEVLSYIAKCEKVRKKTSADVRAGYMRLAFGCISDAVSLMFLSEEDITKEKIEKLDLFNVSEIKRQKGGGLEIKFFDRLKALERLSAISEKEEEEKGHSLYYAIEKSAIALSEEQNE
jgi:phage terminase small subunit